MRNCERWQDEDDEASDRLMGYLIVGAFTGLLIICAILGIAINQFLWS